LVRGTEQRYLLPDSFVSYKNTSNKPNFIDLEVNTLKKEEILRMSVTNDDM